MPNYSGNDRHKNSEYGDSYNYNKKSNFENISSNSKKYKKKKKGRTITNVFIIILSIIFALAGSMMIYTYNTLDSMNFESIDDPSTTNKSTEGLLNDSMVLNVLLFGSDSRTDSAENGRSDSIMMISIDNRHKKVKMTSFLRDTWVSIPGYGKSKLNHAFAYGGPKLAVETIEKNFGVDVDRYMVVDFQSFIYIVDSLGGIDMNLTADEVNFINYAVDVEDYGNAQPLRGAGVHHLNGVQALAHSRNRDSAMSDFDRTTRQRDVVNTIINEMKGASIPQLTSVVSKIGPMITTNLKKNEITTLLSNSLTYLNYATEERSAPKREECNDDFLDGMSVLTVKNWTNLRNSIATYIYEETFTGAASSSSSSR